MKILGLYPFGLLQKLWHIIKKVFMLLLLIMSGIMSFHLFLHVDQWDILMVQQKMDIVVVASVLKLLLYSFISAPLEEELDLVSERSCLLVGV